MSETDVVTQSTELAITSNAMRELLDGAFASNTMRNYRSAWKQFVQFCNERYVEALPADPMTLSAFITFLAQTDKIGTINVKVAGIKTAYQIKELPDPFAHPLVKITLKKVRRTLRARQRQAKPLTNDLLAKAVDAIPDDLSGKRDKALLLVGFACALRRSELVALRVEDLHRENDGSFSVLVPFSKTDQEGKGLVKIIPNIGGPYDPIIALKTWLDAAGIVDGPIFRRINRHGQLGRWTLTAQSVSLIVKECLRRAGLDDVQFSGHSLRAGFVTSALLNGMQLPWVMAQTGHADPRSCMKYSRANEQMAGAAVVAAFGNNHNSKGEQ